MSSRELKHRNFHSCCALMKILMFSTHSMKYIWYSPQKSKYPLCIPLSFFHWLNQNEKVGKFRKLTLNFVFNMTSSFHKVIARKHNCLKKSDPNLFIV